ncbi:MAG: NAD(P)H-hydrate epimerase [Thaumarchaeota archaeon]|nr:NAD(P)H-hydrate epimerase [Nitrososphaerota archaeon]
MEVTPEEMMRIEDRGEALGISKLLMMENAGAAVAQYITQKFIPFSNKHIVVVCGTGNNGGDGLVCARHLAGLLQGLDVFLLGDREQVKTAEAKVNLEIILRMKSLKLYDTNSTNFSWQLKKSLTKASIIVDAIFGTGVKGAIKEPHVSAIRMINESKGYKIAVDIPSGLDPLTGIVGDSCVKAQTTITFHAAKKGLVGKKEIVGELIVAPIGIPPDAEL